MNGIEQRVKTLEKQVGNVNELNSPILKNVVQIKHNLSEQTQNYPNFDKLLTQCKEMNKIGLNLKEDFFGSVNEYSSKVALACSLEEDVNVINNLTNELNECATLLDKKTNTLPINEVQELRLIHNEQMEATTLLDERFQQFLHTYNHTMLLLSEQFVRWDTTLEQFEKEKKK